MALDFPSLPSDGQIFVDPTTGSKYVYEAATTKWKSIQHTGVITAYGFDKANAAFSVANAAFGSANNVGPQIAPTYNTANAAFIHANSAFNVANNALPNTSNAVFNGNLRVTGTLQIGTNTVTITDESIVAQSIIVGGSSIPSGVTSNLAFDTANAAFASANNVAPQVTPAFNTANAAYGLSNTTNTFAYGVAVNAAAAFASINSNWTVTNTVYGVANAAYASINSNWTVTNSAFGVANAAYASINSNWTVTNTVYGVANAAYGAANNVGPQIAPAFNTANAAFGRANTALQNTNVTLAGSLTITSSLGIGTGASGTTGEIRATNNITAYYSDERLKNVISTIQSPLEKINQLSGVIYTNNDVAASFGYTDMSEQVGLLAGQVQNVLPQIVKSAPFDTEFIDGVEVSKSGQNYKTVQYEKLIPLLVEAIKEQQKQIDELRALNLREDK